jgi:hypothetical protein
MARVPAPPQAHEVSIEQRNRPDQTRDVSLHGLAIRTEGTAASGAGCEWEGLQPSRYREQGTLNRTV